ncbi:hypothetical protein J3R82DRAFT_6680 [Butyriboletus roseoflavus]|nr:hypothetical protein J3R82DRAFT_6680 [Butyriboletus roseoflavus]
MEVANLTEVHEPLKHFLSYKACVAKAKNVITNGLQNDQICLMKDSTAKVDYVCYKFGIVEHYHVHLIGYTHNQWANPSELKGGIGPLEALAQEVLKKKCYFVKISAEEIVEHKAWIADGEVLTPNKDHSIPSTMTESSSTSHGT